MSPSMSLPNKTAKHLSSYTIFHFKLPNPTYPPSPHIIFHRHPLPPLFPISLSPSQSRCSNSPRIPQQPVQLPLLRLQIRVPANVLLLDEDIRHGALTRQFLQSVLESGSVIFTRKRKISEGVVLMILPEFSNTAPK